jgi:hypothetical protein
MKKLLIFICLLIPALISCQDCKDLPSHYASYDEAIQIIEKHSFKIDEQDHSQSSWINGASFKSCDGITGYFLIKTAVKNYIFADMPLEVWRGYKSAPSKGGYYNSRIKGKYRFAL